MATLSLYNVKEQKIVDYDLTVDKNREFVAEHDGDIVKFPGGISKAQLLKLVDEHNVANSDQVPVDEEALAKIDAKNEAVLNALESPEE